MSHPTSPKETQVAVIPLLIANANCEIMTGIPRPQWSDRVRAAGIPYKRHGNLVVVRAEDAIRAFGPESTPNAVPADPAELVRQTLGLQRRGSR